MQHYNQWLQLAWPPEWLEVPIAPKELIPIVLAVAGTKVCCWCDNSAVVWAVNKGSARDPKLMSLLRSLCFFCAVYKVILTARQLPGVRNSSADALSRNNTKLFFALNPQTSPLPTLIPSELQELMFNRALLWTSPNWTRLDQAVQRYWPWKLPRSFHTRSLPFRHASLPQLLQQIQDPKPIPTNRKYYLLLCGLSGPRGPETLHLKSLLIWPQICSNPSNSWQSIPQRQHALTRLCAHRHQAV